MQLFENYTSKDEKIVKDLSKFNLYLIGGTAIDYWCRRLGLKMARKRSNNDLDFYTFAENPLIPNAIEYLNKNGFIVHDFDVMTNATTAKGDIEVDILKDWEKLPKTFYIKTNDNVCVMDPAFLFASKFNRYVNITQKTRRQVDLVDLMQLVEIINKTNGFDRLELYLSNQNYSRREEVILNNIINAVIENE